MIKIFRHISIGLTGLLIAMSLLQKGSPGLVIGAIIVNLIWLFLSGRFQVIHLFTLPINLIFVLSAYLSGNNLILMLTLFILLLSSWDIDELYFRYSGITEKQDEWLLLQPLLLRELITLAVILSVRLISTGITITIGFWPLVIIILILIILLKKLFKISP